jgi:hypothetical protein
MKFTSKMLLPIQNVEVRYDTITNEHYWEILKFNVNKDDEGLNNYFEWLLKNSIKDLQILESLTNVEKFLILLDMRSVSLGDKIQMNGNKNSSLEIFLSSIKDNIINKIKDLKLTKISDIERQKITFSIPKSLIIDSIDKIYKEIIDKIEIDDHSLKFFNLTEIDKNDIISLLPAKFSSEMLDFVTHIQEILSKVNIISGNDKFGIQNISLNVFDSTLFTFLKTIFGDDLISFYETEFNFIYKMKFTHDHYLKMTPNEAKLYVNFFNEEMKRQEEAQSKQSSSGIPSIPSMPSIPKMK